jgi:hypothetical protein
MASETTGEPHGDGIEIELTAADLSPPSAVDRQCPGNAACRTNVQRQTKRVTGAVATLFVFVALRSFVQYEGLTAIQPQSPHPQPLSQVAETVLAAPPPQQLAYEQPAAQLPEPLRMSNPFDRSEVFEFPPGTSKAEARESIANVLLERARERGPQLGAVKRRARQPLSGVTSAS